MTDQVFGQQDTSTADNDFNVLWFAIRMFMQKVQTATLVRVVSCSNNGGLLPTGTVTVQPLVNQMTAQRQAVPHGELYNIPYLRFQGGSNAIILDPVADDIGLMVCASRDISLVKQNKTQANPGSLRLFDWADGLYIGRFLGNIPAQYVQFFAGIVLGAGVVSTSGNLSAGTGANGVFTSLTGQTVTVQNGIIVNID